MLKASEIWQLFDPQGRPIIHGIEKETVLTQGLLHGAAHVWLWRIDNGVTEVLLQKRAQRKPTWPDHLDITAAGHIDEGETPLEAGLRETHEEIGLILSATDLELIGVHRMHMAVPNSKYIENELQWLYLAEFPGETVTHLETVEVDSLIWKSIELFATEAIDPGLKYVPHGEAYFSIVIDAIMAQSKVSN